MDDLGRVDVLESSQELVEEKLVVLFGERLLTFDDLGEVSVHHFRNDVSKLSWNYTSSNSYRDFGRTMV